MFTSLALVFANLALIIAATVAAALTFFAGMFAARRLAKLMPTTGWHWFDDTADLLTQDFGESTEKLLNQLEIPMYLAFIVCGLCSSWLACFAMATGFMLTGLWALINALCNRYAPSIGWRSRVQLFQVFGRILVVLIEIATDIAHGERRHGRRYAGEAL